MGGKVGKILPLVALAGAAVSSGGVLPGLAANWGKMSTLSKIGLGLKGVSGVGGILNAGVAADQQAAMLALQQGRQNVSDASLGLEISQRALATQQRLRRTLAALNVRANAFGADLSSGSLSNLMDSAFLGAQNASQTSAAKRQGLDQAGRTADQIYAYKRRAVGAKRTGSVIADLVDFGGRATRTINAYSSKGR